MHENVSLTFNFSHILIHLLKVSFCRRRVAFKPIWPSDLKKKKKLLTLNNVYKHLQYKLTLLDRTLCDSRNLGNSVATSGSDLITDSSICVRLLFCSVSQGTLLISGGIKERADQPSADVWEDKYWALWGRQGSKTQYTGRLHSYDCELKAFVRPESEVDLLSVMRQWWTTSRHCVILGRPRGKMTIGGENPNPAIRHQKMHLTCHQLD